jgi:hypothetical protein
MRAPAKSKSLPPPVGGWDTRNALADMPVENAVVLDNWFPSTDKVTARRGFAAYATGMTGAVETLLEYTGVDGVGKLYAANNGNIYSVTDSGAVGAAAVSGLSNDRWQQVQIGTSAGQFLFAVNGEDAPVSFNGSTWANPSISASGLTASSLIWCNLHQRRLWFGESASLKAWYLAVDSISGTPNGFSLAAAVKRGGYIVGMGTWTRDAGDGQDDVAVFITSEGEAVVYSGTDPASASTWVLVGRFDIGKPIGRRCMLKAGGDLVIVTQDGFIPMSAALTKDRSQTEIIALSAQINKAVNDAVRDYGSTFGWQPFIYPKGTQFIFNIPQANSTYNQFVFNTITGAPCRFTGINAVCWGIMGNNAYFGGTDGVVYLYDTGQSDGGANIEWDALQAFTYFQTPGRNKSFKRVEPIFQSDGNPNVALDLNTDFQIKTFEGVTAASPTSAALWGISLWGVGVWGSADQIYRGWRGVRGVGRAAAIRVRGASTTARPSWIATNFLYTEGGLV